VTCLETAIRHRALGRALRTAVADDEIERIRTTLGT
jgi:hypothetical protein